MKEPLNSFQCNNNAKIVNPKIFTAILRNLIDCKSTTQKVSFLKLGKQLYGFVSVRYLKAPDGNLGLLSKRK